MQCWYSQMEAGTCAAYRYRQYSCHYSRIPLTFIKLDNDQVFFIKSLHIKVNTSLPYFGVKLSCVCLMFAYRKIAYRYPKVTHSDPTHLPLPTPTSPEHCLAIS